MAGAAPAHIDGARWGGTGRRSSPSRRLPRRSSGVQYSGVAHCVSATVRFWAGSAARRSLVAGRPDHVLRRSQNGSGSWSHSAMRSVSISMRPAPKCPREIVHWSRSTCHSHSRWGEDKAASIKACSCCRQTRSARRSLVVSGDSAAEPRAPSPPSRWRAGKERPIRETGLSVPRFP